MGAFDWTQEQGSVCLAAVAGFQELHEAGVGIGVRGQVVGQQCGVHFGQLAGAVVVLDDVDGHEAGHQRAPQ